MDLQKLIEVVRREASGERALEQVSRITHFHRIQASPGYRAAAYHCLSELRRIGIDSEMLSYPFDGRASYWGMPSFLEWHAEEATLEVWEPRKERFKLADFSENRFSLIQRSCATSERGVLADLVRIEHAEEPRSYRGLDLEGKVVFTSTAKIGTVYEEAVRKRKALGIVTDHLRSFDPVRDQFTEPDAVTYTSFWWGMEKAFGFVLSPRTGARLRKLCSEGGKVRVKARVRSQSRAGALENVTALIRGRGERELIVVAHLCHPGPSANDNASGVGAVLETARVLSALIGRGTLETPRLSIRFLLVPEMTGTICYLAGEDSPGRRIDAGINLDMVGQKQDLCGSTLCFEDPPLSSHLFMVPLLEEIWDGFALDCRNPGRTDRYSSVRRASTDFSGGSDHLVLSDPAVDIPSPMIIQWPDRFYHTSHDTIDKVDPDMLERIVVLAASAVGFLASADPREIRAFLPLLVSRARERMVRDIRGRTDYLIRRSRGAVRSDRPEPLGEVADYGRFLAGRYARSLDAFLRRFGDGSRAERRLAEGCKRELTACALEESRLAQQRLKLLGLDARRTGGRRLRRTGRSVRGKAPRRVFPGPAPLFLDAFERRLRLRDRRELRVLTSESDWSAITTSALFWADGKRDIDRISSLVKLELGYTSRKMIESYFRLLKAAGFIAWR